MYFDEGLQYRFSLATNSGVPQALSNMIARGHSEYDLYDLLLGCEWDASAVCDVLNRAYARGYLYDGDWVPRRTLPRRLVVEGTDSFGNKSLLTLKLQDGEPSDEPGYALGLSLSTHRGLSESLSNMIYSGYNREDVLDYIYNCDWNADAFADALNDAYRAGILNRFNWQGRRTTNSECVVEGVDGFGNVSFLKIKTLDA